MRRSIMLAVALLSMGAVVAIAPGTAGAYGGGSGHDMWQVGLSFNCNNPSFCGSDLGGFWGWAEFDRSGTTTWGDAELAGCGHNTGGGGPGSAGAGHFSLEINSWHIGPSTPDDPNYPNGHEFYIDSNEVTFTGHGGSVTVVNDPEFMGDTGIPVEPGHYAFHPAPGVAGSVQVSYRPAH
jgi:hypothetical protein